ncbi:MAG: RNA polymerase sigma factor [Rubripirellula sp.]
MPNPVAKPIDDEWIREHYSRIHRAAWLMTGDAWAAEDLAQETFIVALDRWDRFEGRSSESTWLHGILMQLARRRGRTLARLRRRLSLYFDQTKPETQADDTQNGLAAQEWRQSIWAEVAKLPQPQRDAVTLRFANEMDYEQIASALGCAVGTAKTRVHHGIKRLREQMTSKRSNEASCSTESLALHPEEQTFQLASKQ